MTESADKTRPAKRRLNGLYIFAAIILVMIFTSYRNAVTTIDCNAEILKTHPDVIMLSTWWCPYCAQARKYFHSNNVHYCEYDIERTDEGARLYDKTNGAGIPVLIIDGKNYSGFDPVAFERLMESRK